MIIETVKKAEDDDSMIVRMYDAFDRRGSVTVKVNGDFKQAYLCDILENNESVLEFKNNEVTVPVKNFEIVTLKFTR